MASRRLTPARRAGTLLGPDADPTAPDVATGRRAGVRPTRGAFAEAREDWLRTRPALVALLPTDHEELTPAGRVELARTWQLMKDEGLYPVHSRRVDAFESIRQIVGELRAEATWRTR